jgi:hypothetical protein
MNKAEAAQAAAELRERAAPERERRQRLQAEIRAQHEDQDASAGEQSAAAAAVVEARGVLAALTEKHEAAVARQARLAASRRAVGFAAHTGDAKARTALDALNAEGVTIAGEVESLAAAVDEGQIRLATAEDGVHLAEERRRAREVEQHLQYVREVAAKLDDHLAEFISLYPEFRERWHAVGVIVGQPRLDIVTIHEGFAVATALGGRGIKIAGDELRGPPMAQRRTFTDLVETWSQAASAWSARRLSPDA